MAENEKSGLPPPYPTDGQGAGASPYPQQQQAPYPQQQANAPYPQQQAYPQQQGQHPQQHQQHPGSYPPPAAPYMGPPHGGKFLIIEKCSAMRLFCLCISQLFLFSFHHDCCGDATWRRHASGSQPLRNHLPTLSGPRDDDSRTKLRRICLDDCWNHLSDWVSKE